MKKNQAYIHPKALVESKKDIGEGTRVWAFAHVMKGVRVGKDCNIGDHAFIETGVAVGNRVTIKNGVAIWEGVTLEDDVFVGPNAVFTNDLLPVSRTRKKAVPTRVKRGSAIGANATLVCGITIGRCAMVGAGSTVTKDVPDYALSFGNPARVQGFLCSCRKRLRFIKEKATCLCGMKYKKSKNMVAPLSR